MQNGSEQKPDNHSFSYEPSDAAEQRLYQNENDAAQPPAQSSNNDNPVISWEASEYIHHEKGASWYLGFTGAMLVLVTVVYLLVREVFSVIVLILMGVTVAVYAGRKPKTVTYTLTASEVTVGGKTYYLDEFASYTVMQEGGVYSLLLMPTKRFMPPLSIYFSPDDGEKITSVLSGVLPHEDRQPDIVDRLMRNIRF